MVVCVCGGWMAAQDRSIRVWDPATGACLGALRDSHAASVVALAVSGGRLLSGSDDALVKVGRPPFPPPRRVLFFRPSAVFGAPGPAERGATVRLRATVVSRELLVPSVASKCRQPRVTVIGREQRRRNAERARGGGGGGGGARFLGFDAFP